MPARIVVIGLVPAKSFREFVEELRTRYPDASVTAVVGAPELEPVARETAEECLLWQSLPARTLLRELRGRRADLLAVPYNREYGHTATYWKVFALATASGAKGLLFCEQARLPERVDPLPALGRPGRRLRSLLAAAWRVITRPILYLLTEIVVISLTSLLFLLVLLGIILVDLVDTTVGAVVRRGRNRTQEHGSIPRP